jgi:hypothetical protein
MSQKFEIILKTVYSDRIGRRIAETNIRSVWRHILKFHSDKNNDVLFQINHIFDVIRASFFQN